MKQRSFLRGAVILAIGGVFAKVLGAVYRIPLTNLLGSRGIGLYQLVFPMYTALSGASPSLLTISHAARRQTDSIKNIFFFIVFLI